MLTVRHRVDKADTSYREVYWRAGSEQKTRAAETAEAPQKPCLALLQQALLLAALSDAPPSLVLLRTAWHLERREIDTLRRTHAKESESAHRA